jgi:hypothetical protein
MASVFTKIINREIPAHIVAEDEAYIAFLTQPMPSNDVFDRLLSEAKNWAMISSSDVILFLCFCCNSSMTVCNETPKSLILISSPSTKFFKPCNARFVAALMTSELSIIRFCLERVQASSNRLTNI